MPLLPLHLLLFLLLLGLLLAIVQVGLLTIAFDKLGLTNSGGFLLLIASIFGSLINIPLLRIEANHTHLSSPSRLFRVFLPPDMPVFQGTTLIAINVGGGIIPILFSLYLLVSQSIGFSDALLAILCVTLVSFTFSRPIPGMGIGMPVFIAPIMAALAALLINTEQAAPLAYIGGTLGVLIGADLMRLRDVRHLATPVASIGGAGTFDGIFITGIIAVLLT